MRFFKIILFAFIFNSYAWANTPPPEVYDESKTAIVVSAGKPQFNLHLSSNPTTGYSWFLRDYDANIVEPLKHTFETNPDKKLMGASGFENWTFRLKPNAFVVPQQTVIRLVYGRPWEEANQAKQLIFRVSTTTHSVKDPLKTD